MKERLHLPLIHWKMELASGMYGDAAVDCATPGCEFSCYTSGLGVLIMRLLGRLPWRDSDV